MKKRTLVVGLGLTGLSITRYLKKQNVDFEMFDTRKNPPSLDAFQGSNVFLEHYPEEKLDAIDKIICSPGVSLDCEVLQKAQGKHIPIESDIDCFADACSAPIISITGTNGKSTVTSLVGEMAKSAGINAMVAGNIGEPVLDCLMRVEDAPDLWVLELSSFQLEITHRLKPIASAFLNLSDDHLDRHHDMASYKKAKQRVYRGAKTCVYNRDDEATFPGMGPPDKPWDVGGVLSFGLDEPVEPTDFGVRGDELFQGNTSLLRIDELSLPGRHNAANALAALALAHAIELPLEPCLSVLKSFKGLPHRCQVVRVKDEVTWINDSKGTNVGSTVAAIRGLAPMHTGEMTLIAGGQGKGADFTKLRDVVKKHVNRLILIGEDAKLLENALGDLTDTLHADSMDEAVQIANQQSKPNDMILLSPACASFDWFESFNHRGEVFMGLVEAL